MKPLLPLLVSLLLATTLGAAPPDDAFEITIATGASLLSASGDKTDPSPFSAPPPLRSAPETIEHHSMGGGFLLAARVGYFVGRRTLLEAGLAVTPALSLRTTYRFVCPPGDVCYIGSRSPQESKAGAYSYDVGLVQELAGRAVRPFLAVGVGGASYDTTQADAPAGRGRTSLAFHLGGGVRVDVGRMGVRLEINDQIIHDHFVSSTTEHDPQLRLGFFFRVR